MIDVPSHSSLEDRMEVAMRMKEEMEIDSKVEVLVDDMEDAFNKEFAAWPIRYFIAKEGRLLYKSENSIKDSHFDQVSLFSSTTNFCKTTFGPDSPLSR